MKITDIETREYELTYGKTPRGRGSWAFFFDGDEDALKAFFTPGSTTYKEARKLAIAEAAKRGATRIEVGT